ncbi:MAG: hypothetical protein HY775_09960 [Acidobacteria bacterium]|nr:hypothetical protein [Acidobacteriota bacterium]
MDDFERAVRRRLKEAASELEEAPRLPATEAIRRGERARSLRARAGVAVALAAVLALALPRVLPDAGRGGRAPLVLASPPGPAPSSPGGSASASPGAPGPATPVPVPAGGTGGYSGSDSLGAVAVPPSPPPAPCPDPAAPANAPDGIRVSVLLERTSIAQGENLRMTVRVRNEGLAPVQNERRTSQEYDVWVEDASGRVVWLWSDGRAFAQAIQSDVFLPSEQKERAITWGASGCAPGSGSAAALDPGRYVARALWRSGTGGWRSEAVPFEIRERRIP